MSVSLLGTNIVTTPITIDTHVEEVEDDVASSINATIVSPALTVASSVALLAIVTLAGLASTLACRNKMNNNSMDDKVGMDNGIFVMPMSEKQQHNNNEVFTAFTFAPKSLSDVVNNVPHKDINIVNDKLANLNDNIIEIEKV